MKKNVAFTLTWAGGLRSGLLFLWAVALVASLIRWLTGTGPQVDVHHWILFLIWGGMGILLMTLAYALCRWWGLNMEDFLPLPGGDS
jgi:hypothetical protein